MNADVKMIITSYQTRQGEEPTQQRSYHHMATIANPTSEADRLAWPIRLVIATAGYAVSRNCVPRAIALAGQALGLEGYEQDEVIRSLTEAQRNWIATSRSKAAQRARSRKPTKASQSARNGTYKPVSRKWLAERGWTYQGYRSGTLTVADLPTEGIYIVKVRKHLMALIDGAIHDGYDSRIRKAHPEGKWEAAPKAVYGIWTPPKPKPKPQPVFTFTVIGSFNEGGVI